MRNRALVHPDRVRALFSQMRAELQEMGAKHLAEVTTLRARIAALEGEIEEVRAQHAELRAAVLTRTKAEAELASLYRERELQRAQAAVRDLGQPLN